MILTREPIALLHTESLFLVHDRQTEIFESGRSCGQYGVRRHKDIDLLCTAR